jgi:Flp pilus assembly protein TadB
MPRRYEKEIEKIIDRDERRARWTERVRTVSRRVSLSRSRLTLSSGNLMVAGIALIVVGFVLKSLFVLLATVGALLFVAGYIMYFTRSRQQPYQKRWRGEVVDFPDSWSNRFRRLFSKKR